MVRILACIMVVIMHSPKPGNGAPGFALTGISFMTAPCIGLFFMVSGALLLPVASSMRDFYKKRLSKVIIPTLVWTVIYLIVSSIDGTVPSEKLLRIALSIPFSAQGNGVLWFMYVLTGLYLISPVISPWLDRASKKEVEFVLLLWIVSLIYPVISGYIIVNESNTGVLYYFTGYVGYYLLGYYINKYSPRIGIIASLVLILVPIIVCGSTIKYNPKINFYNTFWYLSIFVVMMSIGWYSLIRKLNSPACTVIKSASSLSFGVYLCHILIMREFIWKWHWISNQSWGLQIFLTATITVCLSYFLSYLIAFLPLGKYVIGYQFNKHSH